MEISIVKDEDEIKNALKKLLNQKGQFKNLMKEKRVEQKKEKVSFEMRNKDGKLLPHTQKFQRRSIRLYFGTNYR